MEASHIYTNQTFPFFLRSLDDYPTHDRAITRTTSMSCGTNIGSGVRGQDNYVILLPTWLLDDYCGRALWSLAC